MKIGYSRVSTPDQNLALQDDALKQYGCEMIFSDVISGAKSIRPGFNLAMSHIREGDVLVVWRLDRLGRTLIHLIQTINDLTNKGIGFTSIKENIDTTTSTGQLIFNIFGSLSQFERELIRERTQAGLVAARARGRKGGRPYSLQPKQIARVIEMYEDKSIATSEICKLFNISRQSIYNYYWDSKKNIIYNIHV